MTIEDEHETYMPTTSLITSSSFLFHLYHVLARVKKHGGTLAITMIIASNCVQARPTPNLRSSRTGEEFGLNHRFTAYDCDHPTAVQALKLPAHCLTPKIDKDDANQTTKLLTQDKDRYQILQKATYYEFDAHQCIQTRSRFLYNCVWASHAVISGVPDTAQVVPPTIEFCRQAVRTQSYVKLTGDSVALKNNGLPTYIKEVIQGELNVAQGAVNCLGEEVKSHGVLFKQSMVLQETQFTVRKVKIRKNFDSGDLMLVESGTTIPAHLIGKGGFTIDTGTYIIPQIKTPCAYQIIKEFRGSGTPTGEPDELIITSQQGQVHLHTHGRLNPPDRCPVQGAYLKTGHLNIIVFSQSKGPRTAEDYEFDNIDARQVSIPSMIALKVEWALYQTSKKFGLVHNVSQQTECKALRQLTSGDQDQPELQGSSESLLYAKGEMLYNVRCPRIEASLDITTTDDHCYKYLPVITGNPPTRRFLIPGSRLLSNVSEVESCDDAKRVPRGYLSTGGHWVAADPRERVLLPPTELQLEVLTVPDTYEREAKGGAYMDRDLAEWARVFTWDTRRTISQTYEDRISQSLGFSHQFREGLTRDQFQEYLRSVEARATFLSFIDPILAYLTPKVLFLGSLCSVAICFCTGAMSIHGVYKYVQQSRVAKVTVSAMTIAKLVCCAPAAFLTDDKFVTNRQAIEDHQLIIAARKRDDKRRRRAAIDPDEDFDQSVYEEFNPYAGCRVKRQQDPSAPGIPVDTDKNTTRIEEVPFVYPTIMPTATLANILNNPVTDNPPAYLRPEYLKQ